VLRDRLHEESISRQVQQALDSYAPGASSAVHSVILKQASIHSTAAKQAEYQNHAVALIEAEKVKAIGEKMEEEARQAHAKSQPPPSEIECWLQKFTLGQYAAAIEGKGFVSIAYLELGTEADILELATEIKMQKIQIKMLIEQWKLLIAEKHRREGTTGVDAADATTAAATHPEPATEPQPTELQPTESEVESEAESEAEREAELEAEPEAEPEPTPEPAESVDRSVSDPTSPPGSPQYMMLEHYADVLRGQGLTMLGPKKAGGEEKEDNVDNGDGDEHEDTGDDLLQQQQQQQQQQSAFTPSAPTTTPPP
jgi:hypothetical protein